MQPDDEQNKRPRPDEPAFVREFRDLARRKAIAAAHIFQAIKRWGERNGIVDAAVPFRRGEANRG